MAELKFKVHADYEKVAKLREEIGKLETQLKGFGRNTPDTEIKAVEAQLAAVTKQYEEMTKKIAEAEAQYELLAKKMTDKAKDIATAQSRVADAATSPQEQVFTPQIDYSLEAQARGYDELKAEIDAIAGSKANLINQMLREQNAIRLINAELKQLSAEQNASGKLTKAQYERQAQLNDSLLTHKDALSEVRQSLANYVKLENAASGSMDEISQSLSRMRMVYRSLTEEERESPFGKELLASIHQADSKIKELDATIGNHQRNVGNYASQWNGLNMSIQQLGRELPALAYGPKVFFSAISNNLPILTDEIKRAKDEYNAMVAAGEKGTPVWKQVASSILSWQMALTVGITLLTMHGDKLIEWGKRLLLGAKGVTSTEKAVKKLNKTIAEGAKEAAKEVVELKVLEKVATDVARSDDERNKAAKKVLETLDKSVTDTNLMKVKSGEYKTAIDEVTAALLRQAQAQAVMNKIQEKYKSVIDAQSKLSQREGKGTTFWDKLRANWQSGVLAEEGMEGVSDEQIRQQKLEKLKQNAEKAQEEFNVWFESFTGKFSFDDIFGKTSDAEVNNYLVDSLAEIERVTKMQSDWVKEKARSAKDAEFAIEQARIDAMKDGYIKNRAQRLLNHKKEIEDLERQKQDYIEMVVEQERAIFEAREEQKAKNDEKYKKQSFDRAASEASVDTAAYDALIAQRQQIQAQSEDEYLKGLYNQYMSYEDKKKELTKTYLDDILALNTEYILTGDEKYKRSIDERRKAYVKAINALESEFNTADYKLVFGDPERMTSATIERALDVARKKLAELDKEADPETFQALSEAIERLENARDNNPFVGWDNSIMGLVQKLYQIRNIRKDIAKYEKESNEEARKAAEGQLERAKKDLNKAFIGTGVTQFGDALSTAAASMREVANASGDIQLERQAEVLNTMGSMVSAIASGAASGGWIGAIVSGLSAAFEKITTAISNFYVAGEQNANALDDYADAIRNLSLAIEESEFDTIFGDNVWGRINALAEKLNEARENFRQLNEEAWTLKEVSAQTSPTNNMSWVTHGDNFGQSILDSTATSTIISATVTEVYKSLGDAVIKAKGKNKKKYSGTLSTIFPDLFDEKGNLKASTKEEIEAAKAALKTLTSMELKDDQGVDLLKKAIEAAEILEEHEESLKEAAKSYMDSIGSSLGDAIVDGILRGEDALENFDKVAGDIIEQIARDFASSWMIENYLSNFSEQMQSAFLSGNAKDVTEVVQSIVAGLPSVLEAGQQAAKEILDMTVGTNYDLYEKYAEGTQQQASSRGYQTLSEETGSELAGRALAQYESNLRMEESMRTVKDSVDIMSANQIQIRDIAAESRALIADSYLELQQIRENTGAVIKPIKNLSEKIDKWDSKIMSL